LGAAGLGYLRLVERTEDGRWIVVDGRRWRATDPSIPERFRTELVDELMSARRAVAAGRRSGDDAAVDAARRRVQDAKVALGERGEPWWEPPSDQGQQERIAATVRTLLVHRGTERSICPSDVARTLGGDDWRPLMEPARQVARDLARAGDVVVTQGDAVLDPDDDWKGPVRIRFAAAPGAGGRPTARAGASAPGGSAPR
jgi:hypothetical protein